MMHRKQVHLLWCDECHYWHNTYDECQYVTAPEPEVKVPHIFRKEDGRLYTR